MDEANPHTTPVNPTVQLSKDVDGQGRKESWIYRSVIGMLHLLVNSTHQELAHSVHQCARFCETPKASHERAVKHILRYLLTTQSTEGKEPSKYRLNMKPDMNRGLESETSLSMTEAEYIAMPQAMTEGSSVEFKCTVFKDNNGCIELLKCPRMRPRTKHIIIKYHHFRKKVKKGLIK
eukprot:4343428-Ditylum_brightwellii.AAC.1